MQRRFTSRRPGDHHGRTARRWAAAAAGLALLVTPALATPAAGAVTPAADKAQILGAGSADAIPGEYIVVLDDAQVPAGKVRTKAKGLAGKYGASVEGAYTKAVRGFSARMSAAEAAELAADPAVAFVEQNQRVSVAATQSPTPSWGLDRIDQRALPLDNSYTYASSGSGVTAYIVDTGILTTHSDFGGRAVHGTDTVDGDSNATDCNGHGTHVAGTVGGTAYGVAKSVTLVGVRVLNCSGSGTNAGVIEGIEFVTADHQAGELAVANMSLGGSASTAVNQAVAAAVADGVTFAVAAGNETTNACTKSPASEPTAITVGATTSTDARASYSNYGTCLDIFAPGSGITSAWHTGTSATNTISGTSMASPHVAGAAALIVGANPGYTPQQVRDTMVANATSNVVTNPGTGSPNKLLYTGTGTQPPDPDPTCSGTNSGNYTISDNATVESPITLSGCGTAGTATVSVDIVHTYIGDLVVSLVAPDGTAYTLQSRSGGSANDIHTTYTTGVTGETANGTWKLRVRDAASADVGYIDSWTLAL
ncbi:S8 family serine peptidase [Myceligenerans crystallogenes]|uniref:Serine protease n=1 Tax=Myceligenerans crystallogenes TaxID=316335 RepID=A0ABP4ZVQ7_9MICO